MRILGSDDDGAPVLMSDHNGTGDDEFRAFLGLHRHQIFVDWLASDQPETLVLAYGNPVGIQGPDIVSIEVGVLERWDLRWRTLDPGAGPTEAASAPLDQAAMEQAVWAAVAAGTLAPADGVAVLRAFDAGTYGLLARHVEPELGQLTVFVCNGHYRRHRR